MSYKEKRKTAQLCSPPPYTASFWGFMEHWAFMDRGLLNMVLHHGSVIVADGSRQQALLFSEEKHIQTSAQDLGLKVMCVTVDGESQVKEDI